MRSRWIRLYLVGLTASVLGTSAMTLVAGIWVKSLTGSSQAAALVSVCLYGPSLLAPLAGLVADRVERRRMLVTTNVVGAGGLVPLLWVTGRDEAWIVFAVMIVYGGVLALVDPAETALFTELVPAEDRGTVNGLRLTLQEGAKLVAPLGGAGLFALAGGRAVAGVDAATFLVAAAVTARIRRPAPVAGPADAPTPWRRSVTAGVAYLRHTPDLGRIAVAAALAMAISGLGAGAQYSLVDALGRPPAFLGVLISFLGAGSIVAGLVSGPLLRHWSERRLVLVALLAGATGYLLLATGMLVAACAGRLLQGFFLPWVVIPAVTAGQRLSPDRLQGRVAAAIGLLLFAAQPVTQAAGAALLGITDYRGVYLIAAAGTLAISLVLRSPPAHGEGPSRDVPREGPS